MSIRTIIELNHDCIDDLVDKGHISQHMRNWLCDSYTRSEDHELRLNGVRHLGSRHHSEELKLKVR